MLGFLALLEFEINYLPLPKLICLINITLDMNTHYILYEIFLLHSLVSLVYAKTFSFCFGKGFRIKKVN